MDLEQRVKTLEYEMKILKNEIQRTLLDIQEQVLVHYYPALRTEETGVPANAVQAVEASRAKANQNPTPTAPVVKQVSLDEARSFARAADPTAPAPAPQSNSAPEPTAAPAVAAVATPVADEATRMSKLLQWALDGSAKMGSDRFDALIKECARQGALTPEMQQVLAQIAPLNRRAAPETVSAGDMIRVVLELDAILGRAPDVEQALSWIEEAKLG